MSEADRIRVTAVLPRPSVEASPRGIKRSRSPDQYGDLLQGGDDDGKQRRRCAFVAATPNSHPSLSHRTV